MKKLIAMLLALAIVASFGVTSMVASADFTAAESAALHQDYINYYNDFVGGTKAKAASLNEINNFWVEYARERTMILETAGAGNTDESKLSKDYAVQLKELDAAAKVYVKEAQMAWKALGYQYTTDVSGLYDWAQKDANLAAAAKDALVDGKMATVATEQKAEAVLAASVEEKIFENTLWFNYFNKKAKEEAAEKAAKEAAEKAAKARAALVAEVTKGIDTSTPAGQLLADATIAKYDADVALKAAKEAADTAKKAIEVAKKGAYTDVMAAVVNTQAYAYNQMASEINTAVATYVADVAANIAAYYADNGIPQN